MAYTLHQELTDGTLEAAFISYRTKAAALRVAKEIAKTPAFMVARIVVENAKTELSIAAFDCPQEAGH